MKILNELVELANKANASGQGTPEMVEFRVVANPDNIIAIAEAFLKMKQRAEAVEAKAINLNDGWLNAINERDEARAKLAEYEKQEPIDFRWRWASDENAVWTYCHMDRLKDAVAAFGDNVTFELVYNRPAPAASLAEMVPDEKAFVKPEFGTDPYAEGRVDGFNLCRAAILRNIEEAK